MTATQAQAMPAVGDPPGGGLPLSATERTRHRRLRALGRADRESLYAVLHAGLVAHLGVIIDGWPMVVPTVYGFNMRTLYLHGSVASRSLNTHPPANTATGRGLGENPRRPARRWPKPGRCTGPVGRRTAAGYHLAAGG